MNAAAAISENLFQPKHGVIDSKASVLTDMMMNRIGKTNGDTMEKDDFYRLFQTFSKFFYLLRYGNHIRFFQTQKRRFTKDFSHRVEQLKRLGIELIQEDCRCQIIMLWARNWDFRY